MADIKTNVNVLEGDKVELEIEVQEQEVKAQVNKAIREIGKDIKLPGFRPGKVPRNILVSRIGKENIYSQTLEESMAGWYEAAIIDSGIKPIDKPEIDVAPLEDEDKPFSFKVTVAVMPTPKLGEYTGIEAEKEEAAVEDVEIDEEIDRLRKRTAKLEEIEGRPSAEGDFVVVDFAGSIDGEPLEGGTGKDYMLELGSNTFIPGFEEQIAGMEKGQSKKLKLTFPETYKPEKLAGKEVEFDVELKEIKERILPEADDGFASENSEFDTIAELTEDIRARILKGRENQAENMFRQKVVEKVVEAAEVEVPEPAILQRAHDIEMNFAASLQRQGFGLEEYLKQTEQDKKTFEEHFRKQAEQDIKQELVLEAIAAAEKFEVSDGEVEDEIRVSAIELERDPEEFLQKMKDSQRLGIVKEDLLRRKAWEMVCEKAVAVPVTAEKAAEDTAEEEIKEEKAEKTEKE